MEGFITEPNDIYLWNIVTYGAHRRHRLLFIICKYHSIFLCVTTGSVALLVYKPFVYFIISLSNKVLLFNSRTPDYSTKVCGAFQLSLKASLFLLRVICWHSVGPIGASFFIHHGYLLTFLTRASKVFPLASMCPPPPPTSHDNLLVVSSASICPPPPPWHQRVITTCWWVPNKMIWWSPPVLYPPPQFPSGSECFRVFLSVSDHISTKFQV